MIEALLSQAAEAVQGRLEGTDGLFRGVSTDTRELLEGSLFVALKGTRFDGHDFIGRAWEAGANGLMVKEGTKVPRGASAIVVPDTLSALGRLAAWYRDSLQGKVVAVTGSIGKSTTRRLLASMLPGIVHEAPSSFNNSVGVPLTLLSAPRNAGYVLCEAGINHPGEMAVLAGIIRPDAAVLTTIAPVHLKALGSLENVAREKAVLLNSVREGGLVVHGSHRGLLNAHMRPDTGKSGTGRAGPDEFSISVRLIEVTAEGLGRYEIALEERTREVSPPIPPGGGEELLSIALETALRLGAGPWEALEALQERFRPLPGRWEVHRIGSRLAVNDAMNSNPDAAERALGALMKIPAPAHAALLGDMLELGPEGEFMHEQTGRRAAEYGLNVLLATGKMADSYLKGFEAAGGGTALLAGDPLGTGLEDIIERNLPDGGVLLVKASHSLGLYRLFEG